MYQTIRLIGVIFCAALVVSMSFIMPAFAQEEDAAEPAASEGVSLDNVEVVDPRTSQLVEVDWIEEMTQGGLTMVFLGLLSVALMAFLIERFLTLRRQNFMPPGLLTKVRPLFAEKKYDEILAICEERKSPMAEIIAHCVNFRATNFDIVQAGAADIGARVVIDQEEKCAPLTVIAGIAPLLGLLGTMIGMIEAFKLVEVFGDEGGASLLAGSISKALITTAVGLVLAIPAILGFHWARRRVHQVSNTIEVETENLLKLWFLGGNK